MIILRVRTASGRDAARFPVDGELSIGRAPTCDIVVNDPRISRRHATLTPRGATYVLEDLGSSNGTYIGAKKVTKHAMVPGERFQIGAAQFELCVVSSTTTLSRPPKKDSRYYSEADKEELEEFTQPHDLSALMGHG